MNIKLALIDRVGTVINTESEVQDFDYLKHEVRNKLPRFYEKFIPSKA